MATRRTEDRAITPREEAVRRAHPHLGVLLDWFSDGYGFDRPTAEAPLALLSNALGNAEVNIDMGTAYGVAQELILEVGELAEKGTSPRGKIAANAAANGFATKATMALHDYRGEIMPIAEDQILAVAHLVQAVKLGAGEPGVSFYDVNFAGKESLDVGMMYLARVIPMRRPVPPAH